MEQVVKNMETKARIKGLPVYRLTGVTTDNVSVIKSTEMWVHYPWLGNDGWCLAVPDPMRVDAMTSLGHHGITLEDMEELPDRDIAERVARGIVKLFFVIFGLTVAITVGGSLGWLIVFAVGAGLIWSKALDASDTPTYAEALKPTPQKQHEESKSPFDDDGISNSPSPIRAQWDTSSWVVYGDN